MVELSGPIVATFIAYLIFMVLIGVWVYRRTKTLSDFALGGRSLNAPTAALSAQASDMSGWLLLGLPGAVYAAGVGQAWIAIGLAVGTYLNWRFVAPRLRTYTERAHNSISLSAYLESRFEDRTNLLRTVSALVIFVFFTLYVASGLVGGGLLFETIFGVDATLAITVATIVIVIYTFLGGFLAVSFTDLVQGLLMFLALVVVPIVVIASLGGFTPLFDGVSAAEPSLLRWTDTASFTDGAWSDGAPMTFVAIAGLLAWGLGYFGQPHILARFMGIRSAADIPAARRIGVSWVLVTLLAAVVIGLAGIAYLPEPLENPETVFLTLAQDLFNPWVAGLILAAVLAAIMSTADSQLLVASTAFTEDFYRRHLKRAAPEAHLVWIGRAAVVAVAVIAYFLALQGGTVLDIVAYAWAGFGAAFGPIILLSLYWTRMTWVGALAGMLVGAATVITWEALGSPGGVYSLLPGFIAALIAAVVGGNLGRRPEREWAGSYRHATSAELEPEA
ncbi:sodium/proline symporter PutP [Glycomyces sp. TRM65418]|uniref:sodium/proline symporter PutP n=1 Tax=Glycomyces sp. TRM65418 TaxID=2867006 RepID=UPI001CE51F1C|nr:sodium/proline symporter PutP [Glycomyces sp. TRM65418]MCC3765952.1 sodium/proline symporter PutP [Glycomyces sp. TRM65418]QZD55533.1 sodium/proline symporter PutP [Glycomyces sp. TRM65418]